MSTTERRQGISASRWRWYAVVAAALLVGTLLGTVAAIPAGAASNGKWSVFPTTLRGQASRQYFHPVLTPGKAYTDAVTVSNFTDTSLTFNLYGADAINTAGGGLSLRRRVDVQHDMGKWIRLPVSRLTVPARTATVVPFTIVAPSHALPGDHVGGIVAEQTKGTTSSSGSIPITVIQAVGVRVYGRVVGPLHPRLEIAHMSLAATSSAATLFDASVGADVLFSARNRGNTVLSPVAHVVLTTPFGTAARRTFTIHQLLPGSSVHYGLHFGSVNTYGHLRAEVTLSGVHTTVSATDTVWAVPWALFALVVLVLLAVALLVVRRVRRRCRSHKEPSQPEPQPS